MKADDRTTRITRAVADHTAALLAYFTRRVDPADEAADLLGETLLILWKRAASLPRDDSEVRPWMFGIARNVLMHHYRRSARRRVVTDRLRSVLAVTPHPGFADPTEYADLHAAIRSLDIVDRDLIGLVHWDGFTLVEASCILRMKPTTVRSRYHRAKATLRALLADDSARTSPAAASR